MIKPTSKLHTLRSTTKHTQQYYPYSLSSLSSSPVLLNITQSFSTKPARRAPRAIARADSINSGSYIQQQQQQQQQDEGGNDNKNNQSMSDPQLQKVRAQLERRVTRSLVDANVHGSYSAKHDRDKWLKKPLFKRSGTSQPKYFASGADAAKLLVAEATRRDPYQFDFLELISSMTTNISGLFDAQPQYAWVFKQLMEPERFTTFRIPWTDDDGNHRINRGYRVQYSSALGHYQGGLRFHPQMSHGVARMLGFEQTLKNAVSGYAAGGSVGGSDFDPTDKSPSEIKAFCESFIEQLAPLIGTNLDTLDVGVGVGVTELSHIEGKYEKMLLGKSSANGNQIPDEIKGIVGNAITFPQAIGYGCVHFAERSLQSLKNTSLKGKKCSVSGADDHALNICEKLIDLGAIPVSISDVSGFLYEKDGFDKESIEQIRAIKSGRGYLSDYELASGTTKFTGSDKGSMWESVPCEIAFLTSLNGELTSDDAGALVGNGKVMGVYECVDRGCSEVAIKVLNERNVIVGPSTACMTGSEIANSIPSTSTIEDLDRIVQNRMYEIYDEVFDAAKQSGHKRNLIAGAHVLAFLKIANSPQFANINPLSKQKQ